MIKWIVALGLIWLVWRYWRPAPKAKRPGPVAEACALLGVGRDADAATIRAAHRRLAVEVHPDRGGSAEAARRINAARDLLLARLDS
ncbi:DnaJ-domain-containing protein 1 [Sphingomonas jinjuensis]|uniref:DnaJ-domain-containing protein 1 n=1 Tax=Sphingomonas jinjuensis TaxID=535907 RepID=A0A840F9M5_9SPHN|nr:J domain-containing protein [Sphingomonas jinjuensis]MBB4152484.1 DnaJ-domain-containing protein 1 [Sphingomonas jinjuensis]